MANRAAGKGYENEAFYDNIKFQFFGIENIHVMRASLQKLVESMFRVHINQHNLFNVCALSQLFYASFSSLTTVISMDQKSVTMSGFLSSLESSGWLKHIRSVLDTSRYSIQPQILQHFNRF